MLNLFRNNGGSPGCENTKKHKLTGIFLLCLVSVFLFSAGATFAWYFQNINLKNTLTAHNTSVAVNENFTQLSGTSGYVTKEVRFESMGSSSVFLRIAYTEYWKVFDALLDEDVLLSNQVTDGTVYTDVVIKNFDWAGWTDGGDGWYYYNSILPAGELTGFILTGVTFPSSYTGIYQDYAYADYYLYFKVEAIQASDGAATLNSAEVNIAATELLFGKRAVVTGVSVDWQPAGGITP